MQMTEELLQDTKIISLYKAIIGASGTNDFNNEVKLIYWRISSNFIFVYVLFPSQKTSHPTRNKNKET